MRLDPSKLMPPGMRSFEVLLHPDARLDIQGVQSEVEAQQIVSVLQGTPLMQPREDQVIWRLRGLLFQNRVQLYEFAVSDDGGTAFEVRPFPDMPGFESAPTRFTATHWREGRIDLEPDPSDEQLDSLEDAVRAYHGGNDREWTERHTAAGGTGPAPEIRRVDMVHDVATDSFTPDPTTAAHSANGSKWTPYSAALATSAIQENNGDDGQDEDDSDDLGIGDWLSNILDVDSVLVTVHADGRVEWANGDIPAEHAERIRTDLIQATGAGNTDAWTQWTTRLLTETFAEEMDVPAGQHLPVPQAVRLDIARDAIEDPDPLAQTFMESEVSFDGVNWRDLFGEEVPPELAKFASQTGGNSDG